MTDYKAWRNFREHATCELWRIAPTASLSFDVLGGLGFLVRFTPLFERLRNLLAPEDARLAVPGGAFRISDAVGLFTRARVNRGGSLYSPNKHLGTDSSEEDGGGILPLRLREEGRKVGAFTGYVIRKALVVADEVSAGVRGSLHVERAVG